MGGTLAGVVRGRWTILNEVDVSLGMGARNRGAKDCRRPSPAVFPGEFSPAVACGAEEIGVAVFEPCGKGVDARFRFDRFACAGVAGFR